eukprot:14123941-Alexandrium_andersonii.AAC.1
MYQIGVDQPAPEYVYPEEAAHDWLQPPLLAGEANYSRDVCRKSQARLCHYDNCQRQHICA